MQCFKYLIDKNTRWALSRTFDIQDTLLFWQPFSLSLFHADLYLLEPQLLTSVLKSGHWEKYNQVQRKNMVENHDLSEQNMEIPKTKTKNVMKMNKCNQCNYVSSHKGHLRAHMKMHSGEKRNKCNLCDFASSRASNLRTHLKTHSGEKLNKCYQCNFASSYASALRTHLKTHSGEK